MALQERMKDALDEARMVILVIQVLLGFQFRVVLERRFERLPALTQAVHLGGLSLLLAAFALGVSPATFHRLAEDGNDTPRALRFASRMVGLALLPFAAALGTSLFVATEMMTPSLTAMIVGGGGFLVAIGVWYVWPALRHHPGPRAPDEPLQPTPISTKAEHALTEARMVLPGAQALLGFQFLWVFTDGFADLPRASRVMHLASLLSVALAGILLIAPAAFHRIAEEGYRTRRFYRYASGMVQASLLPLAVGMSADFYVVVAKVSGSVRDGMVASAAVFGAMVGLWWAVPWCARRASRDSSP
jgi:hypothetical protein